MAFYYSAQTQGFYLEGIHGEMPEDVVAISESEHQALMEGQSNGKQILADRHGRPILVEPQPSEFHEWNGTKWVIAKADKNKLLEQHKAELLRQISAQTDRLQASLLEGYPESEIQSFYRQEREARAYLDDNSAPCEMLAEIARMRKIPLDFLAQKVVEKADQLAQLTGQIIGTRQHFEDLIDQAKSEAELNTIKEEVAQWSI